MTVLMDNKKARFEYEVLDTFEAGIELVGLEVKSLRAGRGSLDGSYGIVRGGEVYAVNMTIQPYQEKNTPSDYDPRRNRRLILNKKEIAKLADMETAAGGRNRLTLVPISVYTKGPLIKVSLAVARGKKKFDKRASIMKRETDREMERTMKGR